MRVRKIDPVKGRVFGGGQNAFWHNTPDGVAQCVQTRLGLWLGQWFLDLSEGTDWAVKVLGKYTESTRDVTIRARILGTPGVTGIVAYSSSLDRETRRWTVNATIDTAYGRTTIATTI